MNQEITFKVLTLNCWGIPYVSKNRKERMHAISDRLSSSDYDVVCLQEVWSIKDFNMIKNKVKKKLMYSHYFYSGVLGSGICIFSKFPIQDVIFHKWSLNGYVHKIHHGDWFGGKGVGLCRLKVYDANVNVYVAHLHAEYDSENDEYSAHRVLQAFDMAQFIRMTEQGADVTILGGDLNTGPQDLAYRIISGIPSLVDTCSSCYSDKGTSECANNSYTPRKVANQSPKGKRIDHILYLGSKKFKVEVISCQQPFPERIPDKNFSYSDHEAVAVEFKLTKGEYEVINNDVRPTLKEALHVCQKSLRDVKKQRLWYSMMSVILVIPIIYSISLDITFQSLGAVIGLNILRLFITALICYSLFMSSIWNCVEQNALKAGCLEMETHLNYINSKFS
ncbi:putative neutral sphingomyelinase isoform X1 [Microplitis demolitor]|uniref:putative neutral sphingomyelinase isoform X1 n=2 Tax=Microplitis demolitor TaxID=69319 RepID=UPI00044003BA|nr:putative neutral sphingomyelinase isoform X1 [Microplitis demolitor]XP_008548348.1 putative neutral sphingomyelinase isoform X1 [Microplitis demolitor]XP_008548349.1 putative neutral sphingomyelinase isoform X1 [Microplitis demolitor]XP_008548350.1 putative neutral sphingomyelinase isoform X1 [Microplitis demolitor]XP_014297459.1 putative neutral sphingomyelinase isoform X1 [Microplitis demolitor]XP_053598176.1 putative neutral sphingomyelinase isoform X1 [Microplitis demolitor]